MASGRGGDEIAALAGYGVRYVVLAKRFVGGDHPDARRRAGPAPAVELRRRGALAGGRAHVARARSSTATRPTPVGIAADGTVTADPYIDQSMPDGGAARSLVVGATADPRVARDRHDVGWRDDRRGGHRRTGPAVVVAGASRSRRARRRSRSSSTTPRGCSGCGSRESSCSSSWSWPCRSVVASIPILTSTTPNPTYQPDPATVTAAAARQRGSEFGQTLDAGISSEARDRRRRDLRGDLGGGFMIERPRLRRPSTSGLGGVRLLVGAVIAIVAAMLIATALQQSAPQVTEGTSTVDADRLVGAAVPGARCRVRPGCSRHGCRRSRASLARTPIRTRGRRAAAGMETLPGKSTASLEDPRAGRAGADRGVRHDPAADPCLSARARWRPASSPTSGGAIRVAWSRHGQHGVRPRGVGVLVRRRRCDRRPRHAHRARQPRRRPRPSST